MELRAAKRYADLIELGQRALGEGAEGRRRCVGLLAALLGCSELQLRAMLGEQADAETEGRFVNGVARLQAGEPDAYVRGFTYFMGLRIRVGPGVLIPRPDSETLVLAALDCLADCAPARGEAAGDEARLCVLETCAGSACLSLALLNEWRLAPRGEAEPELTAVELAPQALAYARDNAAAAGFEERLKLEQGDLWPREKGPRFALLMANPPYIDAADFAALEPSVREFEPALALNGGADGLDYFRRIFAEAPAYLLPGAVLVLEHGWAQAAAVRALCAADARYAYLELRRDMAGRERVSVCRFLGEGG